MKRADPLIRGILLLGCGLHAGGGAFGQEEGTPAGGCGAGGDCCQPHGFPGCDDLGCCELVCAADFFCCYSWNIDCVLLAEELCGSLCGGFQCPGSEECCTAHSSPGCDDPLCCDLVCTEDPSCCTGDGWSSACADLALAICEVCEPPIVCPMTGNCCAFNFTPGCDREFCCDLICNVRGDEFCCRGNWDEVCARDAALYCPNVCACDRFGDLDDNGFLNLRDVAAFQNCFAGPQASVDDECACADYDADDRVTLSDVAALVAGWGPP